MERIEHCYLII